MIQSASVELFENNLHGYVTEKITFINSFNDSSSASTLSWSESKLVPETLGARKEDNLDGTLVHCTIHTHTHSFTLRGNLAQQFNVPACLSKL